MTYALKWYCRIGSAVGLICTLILSLTAGVWANSAPVVTSVHAEQREGTTLVDITYDVADADGDTLTITIAVSDDGGTTYAVRAVTVEGDVGPEIRSGTGKHVVWDAGKDAGEVYWERCRVKVTADDRKAIGGEMVLIPAGSFQMGDPFSEGGSGERPVHTVSLDAFYMDRYEVPMPNTPNS